jgi:hypothetical protein
LRAFIEQCRSVEGCVMHLDATGSAIQNIKGEKIPYCYCFLMEDGSLPVLEFLSTSHTLTCIRTQLESFSDKARLVNNGQTVTPRVIVTDFSFPLLQACTRAFNQFPLAVYLDEAFQVLRHQLSLRKIHLLTFLALCAAHMIKCVCVCAW